MKKKLATLLLATTTIFAEIKDIKLEGLNQISQDVALELIKLDSGDKIDIEIIDESIKLLFKQGYFEDIWVNEENGVLTYHFKEKPIIAKISVEGYLDAESDEEKRREILNIKKGDVFNSKKVSLAKARMILAIEAEGYFDTVIETKKEYLNDKSVEISFIVNKGENIFIKELNFCGTKEFNKEEIEETIANQESDFMGWLWGRNSGELKLNEIELDDARIKNKYMQNGFLDAKVSKPFLKVDFNSYEASLNYQIEEGLPYKISAIDIIYDEDIIEEESLRDGLRLKVDKIFNVDTFRADMEKIKEKIANLGYAYVNVAPDFIKDEETKTVEVKYRVDEGDKVYIRDVLISGNNKTLDRVIRREVFLAPKDLYNLTDLKDSKNALGRTGFFENIEIKEKRISTNEMDLVVEVTEAPTGNIMLGGGYGSYGGILVNASVSDKNIFGSGIELDFTIDYSSKYLRFNTGVYNQRVFDSDYSLGVNLYNSEYEAYDYIDKRKGGSVNVGKYFTRHLKGSLAYQYVDSELDNLDENSTSLYIYDEAFKKSSIVPSITYNNTDDYYIPRSGFIVNSSLEFAGIGGEAEFIKSFNSFNYFYGVKDLIDYDLILRYKARVGYIEDTGYLPVNEKFYMGGIRTVRGYESSSISPREYYIDHNGEKRYRLLGGKQTFSNSIEASIPLIESAKMRLAFFYDYGMIGDDSFEDIKRSGTGVALEWISPVGPIQLIFAKALDAEEDDRTATFEFTMGTRF